MPIFLIDTIKPKNSGSFPMVEDIDVAGGFRAVANVAARDAIPTSHRKAGMLVYTATEDSFWKLGAGLTNASWSVATFGGGGSGDATSILGRPIRVENEVTGAGLSIDDTDRINSIGTQPGAGTGGADVVWAAGAGTLIRLDTGTGQAVRYQSGLANLQNNPGFPSAIKFAALGTPSLWIANYSSGVHRIGLDQPAPYLLATISISAFDVDVDMINGFVWAPDFFGSYVGKIDATTNTVTNVPVSGNPTNVLVADGSVWVASQNGMLDRINPITNTITNTYDVFNLNGTAISKMAYDQTNNQILFIEGANGEISKFDIATETFSDPNATIQGQIHYDLLVADNKLFATAQSSTNFSGNSELTAFDTLEDPGGPFFSFNRNLGTYSLYGAIQITAAYNGTQWRVYSVNTETYQFKHCSTAGSSIQSINITRGFRLGLMSPKFGNQEAQFGGISRELGAYPYENWYWHQYTTDADETINFNETRSRWFWVTDQNNFLTQSRALIVPSTVAQGTWWVVYNNTNFSIEVLSQGYTPGTGVTIPSGSTGFVFSGGGAVFGPSGGGGGGGTLAGDAQGPAGSNVVANITGVSGQTKVYSQLQWDDTVVMGLDQETSAAPGTPTSDLNFTSQAPHAAGGVFTGRPGNINFAIPAAVGGADPGSVYFFNGAGNPFRIDQDRVVVAGLLEFGTGTGPQIVYSSSTPGSAPQGTLVLITNTADSYGAYVRHNGVWVGLGGGGGGGSTFTAKGDLSSALDGGQIVKRIQGFWVQNPSLATTDQTLSLGTYDHFLNPYDIARDPSDNRLWVTDQHADAKFLKVVASNGTSVEDAIYLGSPSYRVKADTTHVYVTTSTGYVHIIDKSTMQVVGTADVGSGILNPHGLAVSGDNIWVASGDNGGGLAKVILYSKAAVLADHPNVYGTPLAIGNFGSTDVFDLLYTGSKLFMTVGGSGTSPTLYDLDPSTLAVVGSYDDLSGDYPHHLHLAFGSLWVSYGAYLHVKRFNPANIGVGPTNTISNATTFYAGAMASNASALFVAGGGGESSVTIVDPGSNAVSGSMPFSPANVYTQGLATDSGGFTLFGTSWHNSTASAVGVSRFDIFFGNTYLTVFGQEDGLVFKTPAGGGASGPAGGDLSGTYPNPTVNRVQGISVPGGAGTNQYLATFPTNASFFQWRPVPIEGDNGRTFRQQLNSKALAHNHQVSFARSGTAAPTATCFDGRYWYSVEGQFLRWYDVNSLVEVGSFDLVTSGGFDNAAVYVGRKHGRLTTEHYLFVGGTSGWKKVRINSGGTGTLVDSNATFGVRGMFYDGSSLWIIDGTNNRLSRLINPDAGVGEAASVNSSWFAMTPPPNGLRNLFALVGTTLYVLGDTTLYATSIYSSGTLFTRPASGGYSYKAITFDGKYLWYTTTNGSLHYLWRWNPPASGADEATQTTHNSTNGTNISLGACDLMVFDGRYVWIGNSAGTTYSLGVVDPDTMQFLTIDQLNQPRGLISTDSSGGDPQILVPYSGGYYKITSQRAGDFKGIRNTGGYQESTTTILAGVYTSSGAAYQMTSDDTVIMVGDNGGGSSGVTFLTLPKMGTGAASPDNGGKVVIVKDANGIAAANNITIQAASGELIEGAANTVINSNYGVVKLMWFRNGAGSNAGSQWVKL